jgi:hypothetical protein
MEARQASTGLFLMLLAARLDSSPRTVAFSDLNDQVESIP